jgi:hypothetical protein
MLWFWSYYPFGLAVGVYAKLELAGKKAGARSNATGKRERSDSQVEQANTLANIGGKSDGHRAASPAGAAVKGEKVCRLSPMVVEQNSTDLQKAGSMDQLTDSSGASQEARAAAARALKAGAAAASATATSADAASDPFQTSLPFKKRRKTGDASNSSLTDLPTAAAPAAGSAVTASSATAAAEPSAAAGGAAAAGRDTDSEGRDSACSSRNSGALQVDQTVLDSLAQGLTSDSV